MRLFLIVVLLLFFFRGNGKKEHLNSATFTARDVCRPLIGSLVASVCNRVMARKLEREQKKKKEGGRGKGEGRRPHDSGKRPLDISRFGSFVN